MEEMAAKGYRLDEFHLDFKRRCLLLGSEIIELTPKQFDVLKYLCEHPREVVTREVLIRDVWSGVAVGEGSAKGCVSEIRNKLGKKRGPEIIKTSFGNRGWVLECVPEKITNEVDHESGSDGGEEFPTSVGATADADGSFKRTEEQSCDDASFSTPPSTDAVPLGDPNNDTQRNRLATKGNSSLFLLVSAAALFLPLGLRLYLPSDTLNGPLAIIQAIVIFIGILCVVFTKDAKDSETSQGNYQAQAAVRQFRKFWIGLLLTWLGLYLVWGLFGTKSNPSRIAATLLNDASSLMLALCYVVLNRPTVVAVEGSRVKEPAVKLGLLVVAASTFAEIILIVLLNVFAAGSVSNALSVVDLLSGTVGGIALALCISRLHSRLLGPSTYLSIVSIILFLYPIIQPFYVLLNAPFGGNMPPGWEILDAIKPWIISIAFALKTLMFLYVMQLFRSERLLFYMIHARRIYDDVEEDWAVFESHRNH